MYGFKSDKGNTPGFFTFSGVLFFNSLRVSFVFFAGEGLALAISSLGDINSIKTVKGCNGNDFFSQFTSPFYT